jgi:hypothetical protein
LRAQGRGVATETAIRLGLFRRGKPLARNYGFARGKPIDRVFIEDFVSSHRKDIRGVVLEAGPAVYARQFGGDRVSHLDVMYPHGSRPGFTDGTLVADLETGDGLVSGRYDCLILTQVFGYIYDLASAAATCRRILRPNGVLLATLGGFGQVSKGGPWAEYWRFTDNSASRLFGDAFGQENVVVRTDGNVGKCCAFLHALAAEDLSEAQMSYVDPAYQLTISVRAAKAA